MTTIGLSKSSQKVKIALEAKNLYAEVVTLSDSARTAQAAADALQCDVAQIVKSLIFRSKETSKPLLVLASGVNRVDEKKLATLIGEKIVKADANFTRQVTGFAIGGIPPVGHAQTIQTFIDEDLLKLQDLWAAAGTPHTVFKLQPSDLVSVTNGTIIAIY